MVAILPRLIVLIFSQQGPPTFDELFPKGPPPEIVSVRKVSESETTLKPCQAFTLIFDVTLAGEALRTQWPKIARKASNVVRVNGHDYMNRLSYSGGGANDVCRFEILWPQPAGGEPPPKSSDRALVAAACQVNLLDRVCLFREPGDYRIEFFFGEQTLETTVRVVAPTTAERGIMEKLSTVPMFQLLLDPTDVQYATPENIATLEALLRISSAYDDMLSLTIGVAKGRRVGRPRWNELTDDQKREELRERYRLLDPVTGQERLTTRVAGLAASELANVAGELARLESGPEKREEYLDVRGRLLQRVSDCPLVPREQGTAKEFVLHREQKRRD